MLLSENGTVRAIPDSVSPPSIAITNSPSRFIQKRDHVSRYMIPLLDESGRRIGYGDRWWTHRVRDGPDGPILGQKHAGITIACLDHNGRILIQHRRHRIFDEIWSLSGDTHPPGSTGVGEWKASRRLREDVQGRTSDS